MLKLTIFTLAVLQVTLGKVTIHRLDHCDPNAKYKIEFNLKVKADESEQQMVEEGTLKTSVSMGNNIMDIADIYMKQNGNYVHMLNVKEDLCEAMNKYLGEFMHDLQKAAGLAMGTCPVPPGEYKIMNHFLDFTKFKYKDVPEGDFKVEVKLKDKDSEEILNCHVIEFSFVKN